ncbi:MAG TPA: methyltransferase domain-containing protein [Gaiella sp.]|nr:methyltransferase domain-containing protein [Gaiella sp.]
MTLREALCCPVCRGTVDGSATLTCTVCGRSYPVEDGIPRMLSPDLPGSAAKLRETEGWVALAGAEGWYEPDDEVDAHLPFLCRDLGWDDPNWLANERSFALLLEQVRPGMDVLEVGAAKCWGAAHLVPLGCAYVGSDILADPKIGLGRGTFYETRVGPFGRVQADAEHLPFADASFDMTYCVATLHHALDLPRMVAELARVTRPGGTVAALNEGTRPVWRGQGNPVQEDEKAYGINEHVHTLLGYERAFRRAGLRVLVREHAHGVEELARRRVSRTLLRLPRGKDLALAWASALRGYAGVTLIADKPPGTSARRWQRLW